MNSNQTIDGMLREQLERFLVDMGTTDGRRRARKEIRGLLDAAACNTSGSLDCPGDGIGPCKKCPATQPLGEIDLTPKRLAHAESVIERQNSVITSLRAELSESYRIGGKPRGESVAYRVIFNDGERSKWEDGTPQSQDLYDVRDGVIRGVERAYGEQPAPVAVAPQGWKLVPIHPTAEMLDAIGDGATDKSLAQNRALVAWSLILDAVPTVPDETKPVFGLDPAKGYAIVPIKPSPGLLMSMAIRSDHGLGVPGYYDTALMLKGGHGVTHARRVECALSDMRKLYEEVVGVGFYSADKEAEYAAYAVSEQGEEKIGAEHDHSSERRDV